MTYRSISILARAIALLSGGSMGLHRQDDPPKPRRESTRMFRSERVPYRNNELHKGEAEEKRQRKAEKRNAIAARAAAENK